MTREEPWEKPPLWTGFSIIVKKRNIIREMEDFLETGLWTLRVVPVNMHMYCLFRRRIRPCFPVLTGNVFPTTSISFLTEIFYERPKKKVFKPLQNSTQHFDGEILGKGAG